MAERFFAKKAKIDYVGTFMTDLIDNKGVVGSTITTTPVGLGAQAYVVFTYLNDIPVVATAGGATVSYEYDTSEPDWTTLVTVTDGDHASGYTLNVNATAVDMTLVGTFNVSYVATDSSGNISDTHTIEITITDTVIPVITLTSATDDVAVADVPTWTPVTNLASATDAYDGDVSSSVVITFKEETSGGSAIASLALARTYLLDTTGNAVYCMYNVDDTSSNSAVEKTYTVTSIA